MESGNMVSELAFDEQQELIGVLVDSNYTKEAAIELSKLELEKINNYTEKLYKEKTKLDEPKMIDIIIKGINYAGLLIRKPLEDEKEECYKKWFFKIVE